MDYFDRLPRDCTAYVTLDLARGAAWIPAIAQRLGASTRELESVLPRARAVYAGILLEPGTEASFSAIVTGRFPPSGVRASLCLRADWRRVSDGAVWYESRRSSLQVAARDPGEILVSNGGIAKAIAAADAPVYAALPAEVVASVEESALVVFFPRVPTLAGLSGGTRMPPVEQIWMTALPVGSTPEGESALDGTVEIALGFRLAGEREARLFRPVLRLLLAGLSRQGRIPGGAEALSTLRDEVDGSVVRLRGLRLTVAQALTAIEGFVGAPVPSADQSGGGQRDG
jgi:hypothetical protein